MHFVSRRMRDRLTVVRIVSRFLCSIIPLALAACSHGEQFAEPSHATGQTFAGGNPARLTLNPGVDRDAAWLPDGSGIIYSAELADRDDDDRCLVLLPPTGGRIRHTWCNTALTSLDSTNTYDAAAVSAGGRVAFVRTSRPQTQAQARFSEIASAPLDSIGGAAAIQDLPFLLGGRVIGGASRFAWVDEQTFVFRADFASFVCLDANIPCLRAFVQSGLVLARAGPGAPPVAIAGTDLASSVTWQPGGDAVLFTLLNDTRVYRLVLSTGTITVFYDFGAGFGIVRDVQVAGSRLVAVVGGSAGVLDPALNGLSLPPIQLDFGGALVMVDLATNVTTAIGPPSALYRHPALSPDGTRLVAERAGDLWLFTLP